MPTVADSKSAELFLEFSSKKLLEQYWPRLRQCVESMNDDQIWWRPNAAGNTVGNLDAALEWQCRSMAGCFVQSTGRWARSSCRIQRAKADSGGSAAWRGLTRPCRKPQRFFPPDPGRPVCNLPDSGIYGDRASRCLSGGGALRIALRADCLHHKNVAGCGSGILQGAQQDGPRILIESAKNGDAPTKRTTARVTDANPVSESGFLPASQSGTDHPSA